jgi:hypothetical protein
MRFATLQIDSPQGSLDLAVTRLPITGGDSSVYLMSNANLWRSQMGLAPLEPAELNAQLQRVPLPGADGLTAVIVEVAGSDRRHGMSAGGPASSPAEPEPAPQSPRFTAPAGWKPGQEVVSRGGVEVRRLAAFEVVEGEQQIEITVTKLPPGPLLANLNRWRGQVELEAVSEAELSKQLGKIDLGGTSADYVQLYGPRQTILGAVANQGGTTWFVKLQGSRELAARERENFESFVRSLQLVP